MVMYLDCHDGVCWFVPHPVDGAILTTPQLSVVSIILKIINIALKRLQGKYETNTHHIRSHKRCVHC